MLPAADMSFRHRKLRVAHGYNTGQRALGKVPRPRDPLAVIRSMYPGVLRVGDQGSSR